MDTLEFGGKAYISAVRAAKQNGYTADYMGQLIRAGKLKGQKVGRAWYVEMDSLAAYLGAAPVVAMEEQTEQHTSIPEAQDVKEEVAPVEHPVKMTLTKETAPIKEVSNVQSEKQFAERYQMLTYIPAEQEPELPAVEKNTERYVEEIHPVSIRNTHSEQFEVRTPTRVATGPIQRPVQAAQSFIKEINLPESHYFEAEEKRGVAGAFLGSALAWCLVFGVFGFGIMSIFAAKEVKYTTGQEAAAAVALSLETLGAVKDYILGSN